jgi:hypothetical protein
MLSQKRQANRNFSRFVVKNGKDRGTVRLPSRRPEPNEPVRRTARRTLESGTFLIRRHDRGSRLKVRRPAARAMGRGDSRIPGWFGGCGPTPRCRISAPTPGALTGRMPAPRLPTRQRPRREPLELAREHRADAQRAGGQCGCRAEIRRASDGYRAEDHRAGGRGRNIDRFRRVDHRHGGRGRRHVDRFRRVRHAATGRSDASGHPFHAGLKTSVRTHGQTPALEGSERNMAQSSL